MKHCFGQASAECAASFTPLHVEWQQLVDGESSVFRALSARTRPESRVSAAVCGGFLHCRCGLELRDHFGRFLILDHGAFIGTGCVLFRCTSHAKQLWRQALLFVCIVSKPGALLLAYPITATQWRL